MSDFFVSSSDKASGNHATNIAMAGIILFIKRTDNYVLIHCDSIVILKTIFNSKSNSTVCIISDFRTIATLFLTL